MAFSVNHKYLLLKGENIVFILTQKGPLKISLAMEKFIDDLKFAVEAFDSADMDESTDFQSLEDWDSLALLSIMAMLASSYSVNLTASEISSCKTLAELFEKVQSKK